MDSQARKVLNLAQWAHTAAAANPATAGDQIEDAIEQIEVIARAAQASWRLDLSVCAWMTAGFLYELSDADEYE